MYLSFSMHLLLSLSEIQVQRKIAEICSHVWSPLPVHVHQNIPTSCRRCRRKFWDSNAAHRRLRYTGNTAPAGGTGLRTQPEPSAGVPGRARKATELIPAWFYVWTREMGSERLLLDKQFSGLHGEVQWEIPGDRLTSTVSLSKGDTEWWCASRSTAPESKGTWVFENPRPTDVSLERYFSGCEAPPEPMI